MNVAKSQLVGGAIKLTILSLALSLPYIKERFLPIALVSTIQELSALYFINTADVNNSHADVNAE